jgi:hypothetical protein
MTSLFDEEELLTFGKEPIFEYSNLKKYTNDLIG